MKITNKNDEQSLLGKISIRVRDFWRMFQLGQYNTMRADVDNENYPTTPLPMITDIRGRTRSRLIGDLHLHSSREILAVEKPTWAQWREQMSRIKKVESARNGP